MIDEALKKDICTRRYYKGVRSCDELESIGKNELWVLNSAVKSHPTGVHWCILTSIPCYDYEVALCDSSGAPLVSNPHFFNLVTNYSQDYYVFDKRLQGDDSSCGAFCLLIAFLLCRKISTKNILERFFSNRLLKPYKRSIFVCYLTNTLFNIKSLTVYQMLRDETFIKKLNDAEKRRKKKQNCFKTKENQNKIMASRKRQGQIAFMKYLRKIQPKKKRRKRQKKQGGAKKQQGGQRRKNRKVRPFLGGAVYPVSHAREKAMQQGLLADSKIAGYRQDLMDRLAQV